MFSFKTIQSKLITLIGITLIVILSVLGVIIAETESNKRLKEINTTAINILDGRKEQLGSIITGLSDEARLYAEKPEIRSMNPATLPEAIKSIKLGSLVKEIVVVFENGTFAVAGRYFDKADVRYRDYYKAVFTEKKDLFISTITSSVDGSKYFIITIPITDKTGKRIGLMNLSMDLADLSALITDKINVLSGYAFVLDENGTALMHPKKEFILKMNLREMKDWDGLGDLYEKIRKNNSGSHNYHNPQGEEIMTFFSKIPNTPGWVICATVRMSVLKNITKSMVGILFVGIITAEIIIIILIWFICRITITDPVKKIIDFTADLENKELSRRLDIQQKDEFGRIGESLNMAVLAIETAMKKVLLSSESLLHGMEQISSGNHNLSQRTSEQASAIEEVSATIEETAATIAQNSENAKNAERISRETNSMAESGGKELEEAVVTINLISESSARMSEIIQVINDIAFQTNLLALNAAVEAARAGDQGRGFAVVAGEVRNLAQRSGDAAKQIGSLIKDSVEKIQSGTMQVNKSGESLVKIIESTGNVSNAVSEIAYASDEQKTGVDQINNAIVELDKATQQNAALVEETASASEEISSRAKELVELIHQFRINI